MRRISTFLIPPAAVCLSVGFLVFVQSDRNRIPLSNNQDRAPQCAHWAIFRSAQLLGVPTATGEIQRLLPYEPKGHSMAQLVQTLGKIGLHAEGFRDDWESLAKVSFPCIVHLSEPDHYVVVSGMEPERGYIHIFDDAGNRTRRRRDAFEKRWTGFSLHITKNNGFLATAKSETQPIAVYDHLILDKGDIPAVGEPTEFAFPIKNQGNADLIIEDVKVNCGCLKSEQPAAPIAPGETGSVKLYYTVEPKRGIFSQTAAVRTNDPKHPVVVLTACGFTGVEVRIEPSQIVLDRLYLGRKCVYQCFVRYTGEWNDFQIEIESSDLAGVQIAQQRVLPIDQAELHHLLQPQKRNTLPVTAQNNRVLEWIFEPTGILSDGILSEKVEGNIVLKTNIPGYERFTLKVSGTIQSPVKAFPGTIDLENTAESPVTLVSLVQDPFRIARVDCDKAISCQYDTSTYKPEQVLRIKKTDTLTSRELIVHCQFDGEVSPIALPLTLIDYVH